MTTQLHVDQIDTITIIAVDAKGNVVPGVSFDSPPVFTNSNPAAVTATASADGLSETLKATDPAASVGQTSTIGVTVVIGGVTFNFSEDESVIAGAVAGVRFNHALAPAA